MRGILSQLPFFVQDLFPFFLTRNFAVHREVIAEVYANVVYAMGFAASTDALAQPHPRLFHDAEVKYYNRVLRARGRRLFKRQRETGSSASMIPTVTSKFNLQQTTCLQCGAKGWREHPWRKSTSSSKKWRARCVRANSMGKKYVIIFVEGAGSVLCLAKLLNL